MGSFLSFRGILRFSLMAIFLLTQAPAFAVSKAQCERYVDFYKKCLQTKSMSECKSQALGKTGVSENLLLQHWELRGFKMQCFPKKDS